MLEVSTNFDQNVQRELNEKLKNVSIICLIFGCFGLTIFVFLCSFFEKTPTWVYLFLLFALPFVFGLTSIVAISNSVRQAIFDRRVFKYQFENEFFLLTETKFEEKLAEIKIFYSDLVKIKHTKNYIFLYTTPKTALPVKKSNLTESELQTLLSLLKKGK